MRGFQSFPASSTSLGISKTGSPRPYCRIFYPSYLIVLLTVASQEITQQVIMAYYSDDNKLISKKNVFDYSLSLRVLRNTLVDTVKRWELMRHQTWNAQINTQKLAGIAGLDQDCLKIDEINS